MWIFNNFLYFLNRSHLPNVFFTYFLLVCGFSFHFLNNVFCRRKVLNFKKFQLILSLWVMILVFIYKNSPPISKSHNFLLCIFWMSYSLCCIFSLIIHFELIFVKSIRSMPSFIYICTYLSICIFCIWMPNYSSRSYYGLQAV